MSSWMIRQQIDLARGVIEPRVLPMALMMQGDKKAHEWRISVTQDGQPVVLTGTVRGYFQRADGNYVPVTGGISGNTATVTFTANCYAVPGPLTCVMRLTNAAGDATITLGVLVATVDLEPSGGVVDVEHIIPDLSQLLAQIERCEKASDDAEKATAAMTGMTLEAETLAAGSPATATSAPDPADGHLVVTLGLPQGVKGDAGKSAYEAAVSGGYAGTEAQWLEYLRQGPKGSSAYEVAVSGGYAGTQAEWLASLKGADGKSAYEVAVAGGFSDTQAQWLASLHGVDGKSAYQVAVDGGYTGTQAQWLASLKGESGPNEVSGETATAFTGLLMGNGTKVRAATKGTDYVSPDQISNPNLFLNWDFTNPVNQPGIVSGQAYQAWTQFIDRWCIGYYNTAKVIFTQDVGLALNNESVIFQYLEMLYTDLLGKTFTVTFKKSDNSFHSATLAFPSSVNGATVSNTALIADVGTVSFAFEYRSGGAVINGKTVNYVPMVFLTSSTNQTLKCAKLEAGNVSTLFMDAPMNYGRELQKCMRFYTDTRDGVDELKRVINYTGASHIFTLSCDFMVPMRIKPTITVYGDENYTHFTTWEYTMITKYGFTVYRTVANGNWLEMSGYIADARL